MEKAKIITTEEIARDAFAQIPVNGNKIYDRGYTPDIAQQVIAVPNVLLGGLNRDRNYTVSPTINKPPLTKVTCVSVPRQEI